MALSDGEGFNFRQTSGYVTDPADTQYVVAGDSYPTTRNGVTFGWGATPTARDRSTGVDARLAGINYTSNNGTSQKTFRVDLDGTGDHDISLGLGDQSAAQSNIYCEVQDNTTTFITIDERGNSTGAGEFFDATDVKRTSASDWVSNNVAVTRTFSSTILNVIIGTPDSYGGTNTTISHLNAIEAGGGATSKQVVLMRRGR